MPSALDTSTHPHRGFRFYDSGQDVDLTTVASAQPFARAIKVLAPGTISVKWLDGYTMTEELTQAELDAGGGDFVGLAAQLLSATTMRVRVGF